MCVSEKNWKISQKKGLHIIQKRCMIMQSRETFMHHAADRIKLYYAKQLEYDKGIHKRPKRCGNERR